MKILYQGLDRGQTVHGWVAVESRPVNSFCVILFRSEYTMLPKIKWLETDYYCDLSCDLSCVTKPSNL